MKKRIYIAPQAVELLTDITVEVMAGSNEDGGYFGDSDTNQGQFDDDALETSILHTSSLWDE